ncbi:hypothetical protein KUTeg_017682 [Tegillarca granosa]|uniref:Gluconokinase n=1 Tax=Tegillarca granosa TaxID=220873 RepID=A0ABQ9EFM5_TEGGR|nr:hypothetical protein KUTeg_017682 [Tegillarca granosa]
MEDTLLGVSFRDADEFHSVENKKKMSSGIPLTDEDRYPWLMAIHNYMKDLHNEGKSGVVTCSALKKSYRQILLTGSDISTRDQKTNSDIESLVFVLLNGSKDIILSRMSQRLGHFMPSSLLESQLATLELPDNTERCIQVSIDNDVEGITDEIIKRISEITDS